MRYKWEVSSALSRHHVEPTWLAAADTGPAGFLVVTVVVLS